MTKRHFIAAAEQVRAILNGDWTSELPTWALEETCGQAMLGIYLDAVEVSSAERGNLDIHFVRAVWTAEAYILLFREWNPRFNVHTFLVACGLRDAPAKTRKRRTV